MILSIKNPRIKRLRRLNESVAYREEVAEFVLEGIRLIEDAINAGAIPKEIFYGEGLLKREVGERLLARLSSLGSDMFMVEDVLLERLADTVTPQGIIGTFEAPKASFDDFITFKEKGLLVLDALQDPGNTGTLIRTAAAFDFSGILLLPGCSDAYNPKTLRATAGSIFRIPVVKSSSTYEAIQKIRASGFKLIVAHSGEGKFIDEIDLGRYPAIVVGNEGHGPSKEIMEFADELVMLPMANNVESLNAAVAGSLLIYESFRRRRKIKPCK